MCALLDQLISAAYKHRTSAGCPVTADEIGGDHHKYLIVFSILLELDFGQYVDTFKSKEIHDETLSISLHELKKKLRGMTLEPGLASSDELAEKFDKVQWKYRPVRLEKDMKPECIGKNILPFCKKVSIKKGGTAHVWQVLVQEEFVGVTLREAVSKDPHAKFYDPEFGVVRE